MPGFEHAVTRAAGDEYRIAEEALESGVDTLVAVGGDGTWSHVADRILASGRTDVRFGALPSGTGNDFGRNVGLDYANQEAAVAALARCRTRRVDAGRILTPSVSAEPDRPRGTQARSRHFINLVGFGFDIAVIDAAARARFLRGELLYKLTAVQQLFRFPGIEARVQVPGPGGPDEPPVWQRPGPFLMVTISNGKYFGGGFPIAPEGSVWDGVLHACLIGDASPLTRAQLFSAAGKGRHVASDRVEIRSEPRFRVGFDAPVRFEGDGDVYATLEPELEVEILAGALDVIVP